MENGAGGGGGGVNGFGVPDKETASGGGGGAGNGNAVVGSFGLGENNIMMGRHVHHHHHHDGFDGGGSGGGGAGPTSGANENSIYMYGDDVATAPPHTNSSVSPFTVGGRGGAAAAVAVRLSQAFNCSNTAPLRSFKSPGMATSLGFPFTCAQWKELERQAMVYKYMMASLPVPPDLLLPLPTDAYNAAPPSFHTQTGGSSVLGFSGKNRDLEPGRCKRTDGKKWRCSKEVAPNQKYCERHLHRGRPRSRKPVEDHTNTKKTRLQQPTPLESPSMVVSQPANPAPSSSQLLASSSSSDNKHNEVPQCLDSRMDHSFSISPFNESHRSLDWEMAAMGGGGTEEQLQQLMAFESNVYRDNAQILQQQMSLFHCKDYYGECNLYFNPDLGSLNKEFINAWANGSIASNSTTNTDTGSCAYALSLAMAAGNTLDSEMGVEGGNGDEEEHTMCSNLTLRSPVSWVPFASGGPLAEVLKPSQQHHHHHHPSISNGDSISPAGTTVSSPSGVLQKTNLFSQSDGSVCNSPTVAASELVPFQWLS